MKVFDFDFFSSMIKHPKMNSMLATQLFDLLSKMLLNDLGNATAAMVPLMLLTMRFITQARQPDPAVYEMMQDFI